MPSGRCGKVHFDVYFSDVLLAAPGRLGCVPGDGLLKSLQNYFLKTLRAGTEVTATVWCSHPVGLNPLTAQISQMIPAEVCSGLV